MLPLALPRSSKPEPAGREAIGSTASKPECDNRPKPSGTPAARRLTMGSCQPPGLRPPGRGLPVVGATNARRVNEAAQFCSHCTSVPFAPGELEKMGGESEKMAVRVVQNHICLNKTGKFPWRQGKSLTSPRFLAMVRKFGKNAVVRVS